MDSGRAKTAGCLKGYRFQDVILGDIARFSILLNVVVVVVDPTPPTCCQQSPAPEIMWQPAVSPPRWQGKAPLCRDSSRGPG